MGLDLLVFLIALTALFYFKVFKSQKVVHSENDEPKGSKSDEAGGPATKKEKVESWWKSLADEQREWLKLLVLVTIGFIGWEYKDGIYMAKTAWLILIVIAIAFIIDPPKGKLGRTAMKIELVILLIFGFFPGVKGDITAWWNEKTAPSIATTRHDYEPFSVPYVIPADKTVVFKNVPGYRVSSMECPPENVIEITGTQVRQIDCAGQITIGENELRNKEIVFFQKPGGTKPSTINVWWKKI